MPSVMRRCARTLKPALRLRRHFPIRAPPCDVSGHSRSARQLGSGARQSMAQKMDYLHVVVDLSHHNGEVDWASAKTAGIFAIVHKATQGVGYVDPLYGAHRTAAQASGLWWGAYH